MRNFTKIAEGVNVAPVVSALARNAHLWNQNTLRTTHFATPHADVDDIWLFFNEIPENPERAAVMDDKDVIPYPGWAALPQIRPLIFGLMAAVDGVRLGRVIISRLAPGKQIAPHVDMGAPATFYERYQIALQSNPGCMFHCGEESLSFRTGDIWHFNNQLEHSVVNNSDTERLAVIVDIRSA